jgi:hypothetical protein
VLLECVQGFHLLLLFYCCCGCCCRLVMCFVVIVHAVLVSCLQLLCGCGCFVTVTLFLWLWLLCCCCWRSWSLLFSWLFFFYIATHESIHSVLNVINYLRKQERPNKSGTFGTSWESNFWLELNYLELAEAALKSSAYCTAILYVEIWKDIQR